MYNLIKSENESYNFSFLILTENQLTEVFKTEI